MNFENGELIKKADSKLLFIAFCFEYIKYNNSLLNNDTYYISYFPIQLDATCNGYQHLSLLTGDEPLAGHLNLISGNENSIPADFYSFVAIKLNDYLNKKLLELQQLSKLPTFDLGISFDSSSQSLSEKENKDLNIQDKCDSIKRLLKLNKNRKLVKLPIMVKPYNASLYQMSNYLKEQFERETHNSETSESNSLKYTVYRSKENPDLLLSEKDLMLLTQTIEIIIYTEFPKLQAFNVYLKQIAEICSTLNISIT